MLTATQVQTVAYLSEAGSVVHAGCWDGAEKEGEGEWRNVSQYEADEWATENDWEAARLRNEGLDEVLGGLDCTHCGDFIVEPYEEEDFMDGEDA